MRAIMKKLISRIALRAVSGNLNSVIVSKEADVLLLLTYTYHTPKPSKEWYMKYEVDSYTDIRKVVKVFDKAIPENLMKFHALTGCGTTSYFYRVGKINMMKKFLKDSNNIHLIASLDKYPVITPEGIGDRKRFV